MKQVKIDYQLLVNFIVTSYKNIAWPDFVLSLDEYLPRLKQKEREIRLNNILYS